MLNAKPTANAYEVTITLCDVTPIIWRRVRVRADITLAQLHEVIQIAMGWENYHLHEFEIGTVREPHVPLRDVAGPGSRFLYRYDMGDNWEHEIAIEQELAGDGVQTPYCIAGKYACPPEDCGGPYGYADLRRALAGRGGPKRRELIDWLGGEFDPKRFSRREVNAALRDVKASLENS